MVAFNLTEKDFAMKEEDKQSASSQPKISIAAAAFFLDITVQSVHRKLRAKDIACPKIGNKSYLTYSQAQHLFNLNFKHKRVVGQIVKGGTGKTTTIENIACCANTFGARVLKVDIDPQGNLTDTNNVDAEDYPVLIDVLKGDANIKDAVVNVCDGMDIIPSRIENVILDNAIVNERIPLHTMFDDVLSDIEGNYDFIFIDCPPTMGQAVTAASLYADTILVPLNPDKFSAKGLKILKQEISTLNKRFKTAIDYKVFLNKFSGKTVLSDKAIISLIQDPDLEGRVLSTTVQFSQELPNITDANKNLFSSLKKSIPRSDFDVLTRELLDIDANDTKSIETLTNNTSAELKQTSA